jgi:hypothetical protein
LARSIRPANFAKNLRYNAAADMYFPAGIPLIAVVVLIIWSARQEAEHSGQPKATSRAKPT